MSNEQAAQANEGAEETSEEVTQDTESQGSDNIELSDEQIEKALEDPRTYKAKRFKELAEYKTKYQQLEEDRKKAEEKSLKEQGKYEKLYEQSQSEIEQLKKANQDALVNSKLQQLLHQEGVVDAEAAVTLADRSKIEVTEDGEINGLEDVVEGLKETKQYLFGKGNVPNVGSGTNPQPGETKGTKTYRRSQINELWETEKDDIIAAQKAGNIIDDLSQPQPK